MKILKRIIETLDQNSSGFGAIELMIGLPLWIAFGTGFFLATYLCFARIWMEHWAEESLFCIHEPARTFACRNWLKNKLVQGVVWGDVQSLHLHHSSTGRSVRFQFRMGDQVQWTIQKKIRHPRADRSRW